MDPSQESFVKPPLSLTAQIALFRERGMLVPDEARAERYLQFIGYYRLAVYGVPYKVADDNYAAGVTFDDMLKLYIFDRKLRLHYMDAIERIEVAARTAISNHMSLKYGSTWYCISELFRDKSYHKDLLKSIWRETGRPDVTKNGSRHRFCKAFYDRYGVHPPPSWMVAEVLSFGTWSRIFKELHERADKVAVAQAFKLPWKDFSSWLHALTHVRNICAHHALFWNAVFTIKPALQRLSPGADDSRLYGQTLVVRYLLDVITRSSSWEERLLFLLTKCPRHPSEMGFPKNW